MLATSPIVAESSELGAIWVTMFIPMVTCLNHIFVHIAIIPQQQEQISRSMRLQSMKILIGETFPVISVQRSSKLQVTCMNTWEFMIQITDIHAQFVKRSSNQWWAIISIWGCILVIYLLVVHVVKSSKASTVWTDMRKISMVFIVCLKGLKLTSVARRLVQQSLIVKKITGCI